MSPASASRYLPAGISNVLIERLHLFTDNPRTIHSQRFAELKETIRSDPSFLLQRPPLVSDGPQNKMQGFVYAGNHRVKAVQALYAEGWRCDLWPYGAIPCDVQDVNERTCLERLYRDNNEWADWDTPELARQVQHLREVGSNVALLGFDQDEVSALLESAEAAAHEQAAVEVVEPGARAAEPSTPGGEASASDGDSEDEEENPDGVDHIGSAEDGPTVIGIRKLELLYPLEQFREAQDLLDWLRGRYGVDTNAEAIQRVLGEFENAHAH